MDENAVSTTDTEQRTFACCLCPYCEPDEPRYLALAWDKGLADHHVIHRFVIVHRPATDPLSRQIGSDTECFHFPSAYWLPLDDVLKDRDGFLETLRFSDWNVTHTACRQLAEIVYPELSEYGEDGERAVWHKITGD